MSFLELQQAPGVYSRDTAGWPFEILFFFGEVRTPV